MKRELRAGKKMVTEGTQLSNCQVFKSAVRVFFFPLSHEERFGQKHLIWMWKALKAVLRRQGVRGQRSNSWRNRLTYLYEHFVDVDGVLGTGFYEDSMDGVCIVLGILL